MGERIVKKPNTDVSPLRVERVRVTGLFGLYDHDIPLNVDDRVTIIHGPNGVGKTVLLRFISAIFNGEFKEFTEKPFNKLEIQLSDGVCVRIETKIEQVGRRVRTDRTVFDVSLGENVATFLNMDVSYEDEFGNEISDTRIGWFGMPADRGTNEENRPARFAGRGEPKWLVQLRKQVMVHLIETQRLLRTGAPEDGGGLIPTVIQYARNLHFRINEALAEYGAESQTLDQSFPQRLLKKTGKQNGLAASELKSRMMALNEKRAHLQKIGLLEQSTASAFEMESLDSLDHAQSSVMTLYVEDTEQKLAVLDDIARRITLLLNNVNGKFINKSIEISRENGFVVLGHDKNPIDPDSLSSGEQHELVQLYDLLFRVKPGTLVLIDEPELSLHVLWQKKYLAELLEIAKTAQFDAIIATHSPFIVGDRSDLMVPLAADIDS